MCHLVFHFCLHQNRSQGPKYFCFPLLYLSRIHLQRFVVACLVKVVHKIAVACKENILFLNAERSLKKILAWMTVLLFSSPISFPLVMDSTTTLVPIFYVNLICSITFYLSMSIPLLCIKVKSHMLY